MKYKLLLCIFIFEINVLRLFSQYYSFTYSTAPYAELFGDTTVTSSSSWQLSSSFTIPIGFNYQIFNWSFNTLEVIPSSGTLLFGNQAACYAFYAPLQCRDSVTCSSPVSYILDGSVGNRILKIQFKNFGFQSSGVSQDSVNLHVWIYESGYNCEVHMGASFDEYGATAYDAPGPKVGMYDLIDDAGLFLLHNPDTPDTTSNLNMQYLCTAGAADSGIVYTFIPVGFSSGIIESNVDHPHLNMFPNPATDKLFFTSSSEIQFIEIFNLLGERVLVHQIRARNGEIQVPLLPSGNYFAKITGTDLETVRQFSKINNIIF